MGKRQQAAADEVGKGHRVLAGWRATAGAEVRSEDLLLAVRVPRVSGRSQEEE